VKILRVLSPLEGSEGIASSGILVQGIKQLISVFLIQA